MAGLFKKNPKLKNIATQATHTHIVDTAQGIENLQKQPKKGILKTKAEPQPDYDSGYESEALHKAKNNRLEPAPDYGSDAKANWGKLIDKFKRAVIPEQYKLGELANEIVDSVRVKITQQENYLREIAQGKHKVNLAEYKMLRMNSDQLKTCQLSYDKSKGILKDHNGKPATTIGGKGKDMEDAQAFVMAKDGTLYTASHTGMYDQNEANATLTHASFLEGKPAEMAGVIGIHSNGKIGYISDNSGHYQPEVIDMYRGIKKIQELMPGVLDKDCQIDLLGKERMFVSDFIKVMETKSRTSKTATPKTLYDTLREKRVQQIKNYQAQLKAVATTKNTPTVEQQATQIGKGLKKQLTVRKAATPVAPPRKRNADLKR